MLKMNLTKIIVKTKFNKKLLLKINLTKINKKNKIFKN